MYQERNKENFVEKDRHYYEENKVILQKMALDWHKALYEENKIKRESKVEIDSRISLKKKPKIKWDVKQYWKIYLKKTNKKKQRAHDRIKKNQSNYAFEKNKRKRWIETMMVLK